MTRTGNGGGEIRYTYCRLCEGACGLRVKIANDRIVEVEPDPDNQLSRGFLCIKGKNSHRIIDDPRRILAPQQRRGETWNDRSWQDAIEEIASQTIGIKEKYGPEALALYIGNPSAMSCTMALAASNFLQFLGSSRQYSAISLDNMNKFVVAELMYGDKSFILQRDWEDAEYMLVLGANPRVSIFGQLSTRPRGLEEIRAACRRGGRLVLIDPRRTETATVADRHLAITPGTDTFFLLALLQTIVAERLCDQAFIETYCDNFAELKRVVAAFIPETVATTTNIPAVVIRQIAREFAQADGAFAIGNTGVTQQRHATLNEWAISALNAITGNVDRKGGVFYNPGIVDEPRAKTVIERNRRSRIGNYPRLLGEYPTATLADEILTAGDGQIHALFVVAGNPLATGPDTGRLHAALQKLDLLVAIDLYRSTTAQLAHWLLPATSFYERKDLNIQFTRHTPFPFIQYTNQLIPPRGRAREEWEIFGDLQATIGNMAAGGSVVNSSKHHGRSFDVDALYQTFLNARGRVSLEEIKKHPHGIKLGEKPIGAFRELLRRRGKRINLMPVEVEALTREIRDVTSLASSAFPLLLISRRNLQSVCSWYHLADAANHLEINSRDAQRLGISSQATVCIRSATGEITARAKLSDDIREGVVCLQYGFDREIRDALNNDFTTMNRLVAADVDCDALTGMPTLNGIPVNVAVCRT